MLVVMKKHATEAQIQQVEHRFAEWGIPVQRISGVERTAWGTLGNHRPFDPDKIAVLDGVDYVHQVTEPYKLANRSFHPADSTIRIRDVEIGRPDEVILMAGPCSIESEAQINTVAAIVKESGAKILRGGAFKPRTSPYSFQGLGEPGLKLIRAAADRYDLLVVSEVMDKSQLPLMQDYVDIFQVGARNMYNYDLLKELGALPKPVLLKRGISATLEELLMSAEYIMAGGNPAVILCERGIRTFENYTRNTFDVSAIPTLQARSHLPVIADPSHGVGIREYVPAMARAAVAAGAHGLLVEVHPDPDQALSDGVQSLNPAQFLMMIDQCRQIAAAMGKQL
ncbi:MAG: 3-deoxy-7-phosphoheptulonate synthase [Gemmatimonadetes bacterium]|nr:MAG: 3-deoxy-7-phosphoheptulonate synthase [Gemmatimonadota bacterium]